ncbi:hypothetical protein KY330_05270 [Candidatus Woesearchaeota archaeon]|nr:hypothetical protein [Candidatus Woesearchaeota archaeon]
MKKNLIPYHSDLSEAVGRVHAIMESRAKDTTDYFYNKLKDLYFAIVDNDLIRRLDDPLIVFDQPFPYKEKWTMEVKMKTIVARTPMYTVEEGDVMLLKRCICQGIFDSVSIMTSMYGTNYASEVPYPLYEIYMKNPKTVNLLGRYLPRFREYKILLPKIRLIRNGKSKSIYDFFTGVCPSEEKWTRRIKQDLEHIDGFVIKALQDEHSKRLRLLI